MLGQRRRRWPNIEPTMGQCIVLTEVAVSRQRKARRRVNTLLLSNDLNDSLSIHIVQSRMSIIALNLSFEQFGALLMHKHHDEHLTPSFTIISD